MLITGASSGIGRLTAELFASRGFHVYAGARSPEDLAELSALENVEGIRLDVTVPGEIEAAVEHIRRAGRGLWGLINNAGVIVLAPLIEVPEEDFHFQMDVNVYGPYRVTRAFAPLIIESGGRISTTGSLSGFVTWPMGGPYTISKHSVEAFTEVLAHEMAPFDVKVSVVEPGNFDSRIYDNMAARLEERGRTTEGSRYQAQLERMFAFAATREAPEPVAVAEAFWHAMTAEDPKSHYMVVPVEGEARTTLMSALGRVIELNRDQEFSFTRDELVAMLDELLEQTR